MKIWIEKWDTVGYMWVHFVEPMYFSDFEGNWMSEDGHLIGFEAWGKDLKDSGFKELPVAFKELYEYDLKGKRPRLVCVWVPVKEAKE